MECAWEPPLDADGRRSSAEKRRALVPQDDANWIRARHSMPAGKSERVHFKSGGAEDCPPYQILVMTSGWTGVKPRASVRYKYNRLSPIPLC